MHTINSRPYAWPYHGSPRPERTALLLFSDLCETEPQPSVVSALHRVLEAVHARKIAVVALPPARGWSVFPLTEVGAELVIPRPHLGAFAGTALDRELRRRGLTDLLIAGFPFELGADCTMREANDRGYECLLIEDCCSGVSAQTLAGAISSVQFSGGIFGAVAAAADVLAALHEEIDSNGASPAGRPLPVAVRRRV
jgi:hypothetical protein